MRQNPLLLTALLGSALLSACGSFTPFTDSTKYPAYEGTGYTDRKPTEKERVLARRNFSLEVASVQDMRRPRSDTLDAPDAIRYEYEPNDLMNGVTYRAPVLLNKYLVTNAKQPKHYLLDVKIRNLKAQVVNGTIYSGGRMGRYRVLLEVDVLARRAGSSLVVLNDTMAFELYQPRRSFNGRDPSAEMDRARLYDLVEDAFRQTAEKTGWLIRGNDRAWDPVKEQIAEDKAAAARALQAQRAAEAQAKKAAANNASAEGGQALPPRDEYIAPNKPSENW